MQVLDSKQFFNQAEHLRTFTFRFNSKTVNLGAS